jgi:hypothetical protein
LDIDNGICYNRSTSRNLEFIVENQGTLQIEGFQVFLIDSDDNFWQEDSLIPLGAHNTTRYNISLNSADIGFDFKFPPTSVVLSPIISVSEQKVADVCSDNRLEIEDIEQC